MLGFRAGVVKHRSRRPSNSLDSLPPRAETHTSRCSSRPYFAFSIPTYFLGARLLPRFSKAGGPRGGGLRYRCCVRGSPARLGGSPADLVQLVASSAGPFGSQPILLVLAESIIEHHESMLLLLRNGKTGSAFALACSVVEGMYRGMWINFVATDVQIERFERTDEIA